ncbi:conserved hypothetical protein [Beggiatoa sp. PS]|nr:conserved hypothetical protein [Beggiatoa sp. PS]
MPDSQIENRLKKLEEHLKAEEGDGNDILYDVVQSFRQLDKIAYKLGFLSQDQSYATRLSWWPMISVLGLYSAGKSTFINHYLGHDLQRTGTQAVDDKFTVVCFSGDEGINTLPGIALDADPRFPFYQVSHDIAQIAENRGQKVDTYLQLKTCPSEKLCGKILIDSPGFDADSQRSSTLRITQYITDLSDLVLVFFDARHPEPGAMRDTLEHLVTETVDRPDSNKFLYILNQMDVTAKEDNQEEVVAAWQRSLAQAGLTAGRFYRIYNQKMCTPLPEKIKERLERKCQADLKDIEVRMEQVGRERAYRVIGMLEQTTKEIEHKIVPQLTDLLQRWKKGVFWSEVTLLAFLVILVGSWIGMTGMDVSGMVNWQNPILLGLVITILLFVGSFLHLKVCKKTANKILEQLKHEIKDEYTREGLMRAFGKNTNTFRSLFIGFISEPIGWSNKTQQRLHNILTNVNNYVQRLNDRFTNPSGKKQPPVTIATEETPTTTA